MHSLPLFHRIAGTKVVVVGGGETATAKRRLVERAGATCCGEDEADAARLAFVALEDPAEVEAAARRLKACGLLVNVADRPELCDFTLPSVLERGEVLVAVSTGGASAGLAKQLRLRLETLLPSSLGALAEALSGARQAMRRRWPDPGERRAALDAALAQGGPLDPFDTGASVRVPEWLDQGSELPPQRTLEFRLLSDDPDDLTLGQARLLGEADAVVHDPSIPAAILDRARADAMRLPLGAAPPPEGRLVVILRR